MMLSTKTSASDINQIIGLVWFFVVVAVFVVVCLFVWLLSWVWRRVVLFDLV